MHATTGLSDLYFGRAAAENEVASDADRFVETYFDQWDLLSTFEGHNRFLILGPKGSGKSAAAHYIQLQWKRRFGDHAVFATYVDFDDLNRTQTPLASLDKKLVGDVPALTDSAWRLFLAVRLLDSLMRDNACAFGSDPQVLKLVGELRSSGLASDDFPQVLRRVREKRGSVGVPKLGQVQAKAVETSEVSVGQLGDALIELVIKAPTANRHLLAIDGLDKAIGDKPAYWQTLAALVRVADALTRRLREHNAVHVHLLVLCRSDVFRRVRFADAAKIAADGGIYTDWGAEAANPKDVRLWEYISRKARTPIDDLFEFFPTGVRVGEEGRVAIERYLLQVTRYTPRDMTLLFNTLSDFSGDGVLSNAQVRRGADTFASRHLLTEVMAEAHGLLPEPVVDRFEQVISGLPSRLFTRADLESALEQVEIDGGATATDLGEYLFLQGAIGNYRSGPEYVQFYHRRDAYKFRRDGPWILHTGLVYAFNLPWSASLTDDGKHAQPSPPRRRRRSRRRNSG